MPQVGACAVRGEAAPQDEVGPARQAPGRAGGRREVIRDRGRRALHVGIRTLSTPDRSLTVEPPGRTFPPMNHEREKLSLAPSTATATRSPAGTAEKLGEVAPGSSTARRNPEHAASTAETPEDRRRRMDEALAAFMRDNDAVLAELAKR
jgi:hypothetical protein